MTTTSHLVGRIYIKQPNGREAQVSGLKDHHGRTYAVMYWPDRDAETYVLKHRLTPKHHWHPAE